VVKQFSIHLRSLAALAGGGAVSGEQPVERTAHARLVIEDGDHGMGAHKRHSIGNLTILLLDLS